MKENEITIIKIKYNQINDLNTILVNEKNILKKESEKKTQESFNSKEKSEKEIQQLAVELDKFKEIYDANQILLEMSLFLVI